MRIAKASHDELELVCSIMHEAFQEYAGQLNPPSGALSETVDVIRAKIEGRGGAILAWKNDQAVGSAQYFIEKDYMYIGRISVKPSSRGQGIGRAIVLRLEALGRENGCNHIRLEVRKSLPANVAYYLKLNYKPVEEHEYPCRSDRWYVMAKQL